MAEAVDASQTLGHERKRKAPRSATERRAPARAKYHSVSCRDGIMLPMFTRERAPCKASATRPTSPRISHGQGGPSIKVRLLNVKSGKPLKGAVINVIDPKREKPNQNPIIASAKTDADGIAVFRIPEGLGLIVISYGDVRVDRCTPSSPFSVAQMLKTGIVGINNCSGGKFQHSGMPKPGELIVFGKPLSWWEKMKRSD